MQCQAALIVCAAALLVSCIVSDTLTPTLLYSALWVQRAGSCLALSGAAAVGPKRLSSDTYRILNKACLLLGSINLAHLLSTAITITAATTTITLSISTAMTIVAELLLMTVAAVGWKAGADYKKNLM